MKEWRITNKVGKLLSFGSKKNVKELEHQHSVGRYINRMNVVIQESTLQLERHLMECSKQIAKEEFKK